MNRRGRLERGRHALSLVLILPLLGACGPGASAARPATSVSASPTAVAVTPSVASPVSAAPVACSGQATPEQTEGPYFKPGSPARTSLVEPGMSGTRLLLGGHVTTLSCRPVAGAVLDFWQADASGTYDNIGYRLRGHQSSAADGAYTLETIAPGLYPGRTEHIHVRVQAPDGPVLTTQLYFPGVTRNQQDSIFDSRLLMQVRDVQDGKAATFDFVLNLP